jgi:hypothetical protein
VATKATWKGGHGPGRQGGPACARQLIAAGEAFTAAGLNLQSLFISRDAVDAIGLVIFTVAVRARDAAPTWSGPGLA